MSRFGEERCTKERACTPMAYLCFLGINERVKVWKYLSKGCAMYDLLAYELATDQMVNLDTCTVAFSGDVDDLARLRVNFPVPSTVGR